MLLDSHALIWAADDPAELFSLVQSLLKDPSHDRLMSAATLWEISIKFGHGTAALKRRRFC
jgi:PIN domain nuclease of toxin-antitoxin system